MSLARSPHFKHALILILSGLSPVPLACSSSGNATTSDPPGDNAGGASGAGSTSGSGGIAGQGSQGGSAGHQGTAIGPDGGTVVGPDGVKLEIPAGALEESVLITITTASSGPIMSNTVPVGGGYAFGPSGTKFRVPALLTMPFDRTMIPAGDTIAMVDVSGASEGEEPSLLRGLTIDEAHVQVPLSHFSYWIPVIVQGCWVTGIDYFDLCLEGCPWGYHSIGHSPAGHNACPDAFEFLSHRCEIDLAPSYSQCQLGCDYGFFSQAKKLSICVFGSTCTALDGQESYETNEIGCYPGYHRVVTVFDTPFTHHCVYNSGYSYDACWDSGCGQGYHAVQRSLSDPPCSAFGPICIADDGVGATTPPPGPCFAAGQGGAGQGGTGQAGGAPSTGGGQPFGAGGGQAFGAGGGQPFGPGGGQFGGAGSTAWPGQAGAGSMAGEAGAGGDTSGAAGQACFEPGGNAFGAGPPPYPSCAEVCAQPCQCASACADGLSCLSLREFAPVFCDDGGGTKSCLTYMTNRPDCTDGAVHQWCCTSGGGGGAGGAGGG